MLRAFQVQDNNVYRDFENGLFTQLNRVQEIDYTNDQFQVDGVWYTLSSITQVEDMEDVALLNADSKTKRQHIATVSSGGFKIGDVVGVGKSLDDYIDMHISPYVASILSGIAVNGSNPLEVGSVFNVSTATLTAIQDSEGKYPYNMRIVGKGFNPLTNRNVGVNAADDLANATITKTVAATETWTLTGTDKNGVVLTQRTTSKSWYYRFLFGASNIVVSDNTTAQTVYNAMQQSWLLPNKSRTVTATADNKNAANFSYIIYAAALGDLSNILLNGAAPVLGAYSKLGDFTITNALGVEVVVRVYKTNATGAFEIGDSQSIS